MLKAFGTPEFLLGIAAFMATVLVPALYRSRRKVFYDVMAEFRLLDEEPKCEPRELIVCGRKASTNPKVFVIELSNYLGRDIFGMFGGLGGVDITPAHYERPITFHFGDDSSILDAQITEERPSSIREFLCVHCNQIVLKPVLLNHGDALQLKVLVENPDEKPNLLGQEMGAIEVDGRITGIRAIQRSWSSLTFFFVGSEMVTIGGLVLVSFDFILPTLLGYPPFEGHPFLPDYRWLFSTLWGFTNAMLVGGFLLMAISTVRRRLASNLERDIRASYLDTKSD